MIAPTRFAAALAVSGVLTVAPAIALADGDPASDFLLSQPVFTPFHAPSELRKRRLIALTTAAKKDGFPIRVAVIQAPTDLGAVPQLFGHPATYSRFLGAELRFAYRDRLLVVMPQGYGYARNGKPVAGTKSLVRSLRKPAGSTSDELTTAAIDAVRQIAAASGHTLPANPPLPPLSTKPATAQPHASFVRRNAVLLTACAVAILSSAALCAILVRSRRERRDPDESLR